MRIGFADRHGDHERNLAEAAHRDRQVDLVVGRRQQLHAAASGNAALERDGGVRFGARIADADAGDAQGDFGFRARADPRVRVGRDYRSAANEHAGTGADASEAQQRPCFQHRGKQAFGSALDGAREGQAPQGGAVLSRNRSRLVMIVGIRADDHVAAMQDGVADVDHRIGGLEPETAEQQGMVVRQQGDVAAPAEQAGDVERGHLRAAAANGDQVQVEVEHVLPEQGLLDVVVDAQRAQLDPDRIAVRVTGPAVVQQDGRRVGGVDHDVHRQSGAAARARDGREIGVGIAGLPDLDLAAAQAADSVHLRNGNAADGRWQVRRVGERGAVVVRKQAGAAADGHALAGQA